jgi:hypothetical protein
VSYADVQVEACTLLRALKSPTEQVTKVQAAAIIEQLISELLVYHNALYKACGDSSEYVNTYLESQR